MAGEGEELRPCLPVAWRPGWVRGVALVDLGWAVEGNNYWNLDWLDLGCKCGIYRIVKIGISRYNTEMVGI